MDVWKEISNFGVTETGRLAAIFNVLKQVLMFCLKLCHSLENYNKDVGNKSYTLVDIYI